MKERLVAGVTALAIAIGRSLAAWSQISNQGAPMALVQVGVVHMLGLVQAMVVEGLQAVVRMAGRLVAVKHMVPVVGR